LHLQSPVLALVRRNFFSLLALLPPVKILLRAEKASADRFGRGSPAENYEISGQRLIKSVAGTA
jgi:hypothetical protein